MIGRVVSHYEIVERLGAGGMGEVFKAKDRKLNRFVALKVLPIDSRQDEERRQRFLQEARAASALNHPNIITVHDVVSDEAAEYLVLEYISGRTLSELIPKGGLPASLALRYAVQIASALATAHAAGILHRDLKPGNVMVNEHGVAKLLDFGLAKRIDAPLQGADEDETVEQGPRTVAGTILGTVSYMSPEQIEGKPLDARADVFSFGLVLYEMLTGQRAFRGESTITTLTAVLRDQPRSISELAAETPPQFEQIIERCLRKDPGQRWQSMEELFAALWGLKADLDTGRIMPSGRYQAIAAAKPKRNYALWVGGAVAIVALGAGAGWLSSRLGTAPREAAKTQASAVQAAAAPASQPPQPEVQLASPAAAQPAAPVPGTPVAASASPASRPKPAPPKVTITGQAPEPVNPTLSLAPATPAPPPPVAAAPAATVHPVVVTVPDGSRLRLQLAAELPGTAKPGDVVRLTAADDLRVGDSVVIARGSAVSAVLGEAGRKFIFGRSSKVAILLDTVQAVDGSKLKLRASLQAQSSEKTRRQLQVAPPGGKNDGPMIPATIAVDAFIDGTSDVKVLKRH